MAIFILRDSDRGTGETGYQRGDIIATAEDSDTATIPTPEPFWVLKVTGITKAQVDEYMVEGTTARRTWLFMPSRMPQAYQTYLFNRRHLGFGDEVAKYGQEVADDFVIPVADARNWIVNKVTGRNANNQKV
jgi:hypothetical protein